MSSKNALITGGSGLLGRRLVKEFQENEWSVTGTGFSRIKGNLVKLDLNDHDDMKKTLIKYKPNVVINAAAQRQPDAFDKEYEKSYQLNVESAKVMAKLCHELGIHLIHISTDYVFDGSKPPYAETDKPNPINSYGVSKADSEKVVLESTESKACVLRIPVLYGDEEYEGESAISSLLTVLKNPNEKKSVSSYEVRFPSCTDDIAYICSQLAERKLKV